jgi:hypothetical protein
MRLAQAAALLRPLGRAIHWLPLLVVTPVVPALAGLFRTLEGELPPGAALIMLRVAGTLLGAAAAFALPDPMAGSTAAVPSPRWLRQWLRTALALGYAATAWAVSYRIVAAWSIGAPPWWDITAEAAVCVAVGLAGAAFAVRRTPERLAATAGAATLFGLVFASLFLPGRWSPWPDIGEVHWDAVHAGWLAALPVTLAALAIAHRDTRSTLFHFGRTV